MPVVKNKSLAKRVAEAKALSKAQRMGEIEAEYKAHAKKPIEESLKGHIGAFINKLDADSVIKIMAVGTLAYVIYPIVKTIPDVIKFELEHPAQGAIQQFANGIVLFLSGVPKTEPGTPTEEAINVTTSMALSIGIAALIVQFGPAMLESVGGVGKLTTLFLA